MKIENACHTLKDALKKKQNIVSVDIRGNKNIVVTIKDDNTQDIPKTFEGYTVRIKKA